jgi:ABC-2 type transport system permease protein
MTAIDVGRRTSAGGGGLPGAVAAEWIKAWSVRSTWWCLATGGLLMMAVAAQLAIFTANANDNADPADDKGVVALGSIAIGAVDLAQFAVIALAMLLITVEYSTGSIRTTLQWVPRRGVLLMAKIIVTAVVGGVAGTVLAMLGSLAAAPLLGGWGDLTPAEWLGDVLSAGAYLALISVFTLGVGTLLRSAVGTLTTVFLIIAMLPGLLQVSDLAVAERIAEFLPGVAGAAFMRGSAEPYPPVVGLLVLAGWTAAALLAGHVALRRRDA